MKRCTKCGQSKPVHGFWKMTKSPDGYQVWCKDCQRGVTRSPREPSSSPPTTADPLKAKARQAANASYHRGDNYVDGIAEELDGLIRPACCPHCFRIPDGPIQAHHYRGYACEVWLIVEPMCSLCHARCHALMRLAESRGEPPMEGYRAFHSESRETLERIKRHSLCKFFNELVDIISQE